mgnify:CR=1 FL=1
MPADELVPPAARGTASVTRADAWTFEIEAARKTPYILTEPKPFVLQTALNDFYVTYELNAHTDDPQIDFIELYNRGTNPVALTGWELDGGVRHTANIDVAIEQGADARLAGHDELGRRLEAGREVVEGILDLVQLIGFHGRNLTGFARPRAGTGAWPPTRRRATGWASRWPSRATRLSWAPTRSRAGPAE